MKRLFLILSLLCFLSWSAFAEQQYILSESQLRTLESEYQTAYQTTESLKIVNSDLKTQLQKSERTNKFLSGVVIAETTVIVAVIPTIAFLIIRSK